MQAGYGAGLNVDVNVNVEGVANDGTQQVNLEGLKMSD